MTNGQKDAAKRSFSSSLKVRRELAVGEGSGYFLHGARLGPSSVQPLSSLFCLEVLQTCGSSFRMGSQFWINHLSRQHRLIVLNRTALAGLRNNGCRLANATSLQRLQYIATRWHESFWLSAAKISGGQHICTPASSR